MKRKVGGREEPFEKKPYFLGGRGTVSGKGGGRDAFSAKDEKRYHPRC